ncbi:hypothetical protein [Acidiferrobacter sp.]|uniref:hypothetical protein n=1 Tax=Acidiferrobacter sp. TaxID=1872107 RepID=UPI002605A17A|nr:hypothetical protein [Acidiferrobacter sp.]
MNYAEFLDIMLTALGVILTALAIIIAIVGIVGYKEIKNAAVDAAFDAAVGEVNKFLGMSQPIEGDLFIGAQEATMEVTRNDDDAAKR